MRKKVGNIWFISGVNVLTSFYNDLKTFENKDVTYTLELKRRKRSGQQNRFFHALITIFSRELIAYTGDPKYTPVFLKELVKTKFLLVDDVCEKTGEVIGQYVRGSSSLNTVEMNTLWDQIIQWGAESFSFNLPYPDEKLVKMLEETKI